MNPGLFEFNFALTSSTYLEEKSDQPKSARGPIIRKPWSILTFWSFSCCTHKLFKTSDVGRKK